MTLCHATQHYKAKQGTCKVWSSAETVGSVKNWAIGNYCQRMASNEIHNNQKSCLAFCACFWWRNVQVIIFTTLNYRGFFYQLKLYMEPSPPSVRGCMWQIWLWCGIITLFYGIMELGVTHAFEGVIWRAKDPTRMLTGRSQIFWHT